jgi:TRAP-type C4-dicarboxylate transport system permease small subunit
VNKFRSAIFRASDICAILAGVLLALAILVIVYMIVRRSVGFSTDWELEFAVFMMVASLFLGSPYCLKTEGHVGVGLLETYLPPLGASWLRFCTQLLGVAVVLFLGYVGFEKSVEVFLQGEVTESSWGPPLWPLYATMPIGMFLTALQYLALIKLPFSRDESLNV